MTDWIGVDVPHGTCNLPECERKAYCRQLCKPHYEAIRGYVRDRRTPAVCSKCGVDYLMQYRATTDKCPPCAKTDGAQKGREAKRLTWESKRTVYPSSKISVVDCVECGQKFTRHHARRIYCSDACAHEAAMTMLGSRNRTCCDCAAPLGYFSLVSLCEECRATNNTASHRRAKAAARKRGAAWATMRNHRQRARVYGVAYEPFNRIEVFDQDGWRCGICHKKIDKRLKFPHPKSVSLDHIVPMFEGGSHTRVNAQAAHFICNSVKGANAVDDQLKLIG